MKIYMIRHGATKGNREQRYVGCTDEGLLQEERKKLEAMKRLKEDQGKLPGIRKLYVSPMLRCRETAEILYPGTPQIVIEDFRECSFGEFEYRNYKELNGNPDYQRFIDSLGECGFPGGETKGEFQRRCVESMENILSVITDVQRNDEISREAAVKSEAEDDIALVVHGGTIMAILDAYSDPHRDYYEWQIGTGKGFCADIEKGSAGAWHFTDIHEI